MVTKAYNSPKKRGELPSFLNKQMISSVLVSFMLYKSRSSILHICKKIWNTITNSLIFSDLPTFYGNLHFDA